MMPAQVRPCILSPSVAGSGRVAATTSRGDTSTPFTFTAAVECSSSFWIVFRTSMNSAPSPYLNVTRSTSIHRGMRMTSSCSTLTHLHLPDPLGEGEESRAR